MKRFLLLIFLWQTPLAYANKNLEDPLRETTSLGDIYWSEKKIIARGSVPPNLQASNIHVARIEAEQKASKMAFENLLKMVDLINFSGKMPFKSVLETQKLTQEKVLDVVKKNITYETTFFSDGGVDMKINMSLLALTPIILDLMTTQPASNGVARDVELFSGLILNSKGLAARKAIAPRIRDESGKEVYGPGSVLPGEALKWGFVGYTKSLEVAIRDTRVAGKPLIIRPLRTAENESADFLIANTDLAKFAQIQLALKEARVMIVVD